MTSFADRYFAGRRLQVWTEIVGLGEALRSDPDVLHDAEIVGPAAGGRRRELFDLLTARRQETITKGWPELPEWVFCSEVGTAADPANIDRVWRRVRRRAQKQGVRPLELHCARHTCWVTMALRAGKSVRWVADRLGHADPALTLRVYAHAMPEDEATSRSPTSTHPDGPIRPLTMKTVRRKRATTR